VRATLYLASPAYTQLWSRGARQDGGGEMGPWTEFRARVLYQTYDLSTLFSSGAAVALGVRLGGGMWTHFSPEATALPLLAELRLATDAGAVIVPTLVWRGTADAIISSDAYDGEVVDGRLVAAFEGWDRADFVESAAWVPLEPFAGLPAAAVTPRDLPPVRRVDEFAPIGQARVPAPGVFSFSFPQNFAGYAELDVPAGAPPGTVLTLVAGEQLHADGSVYNQLTVNMSLTWVLSGAAETVGNSFCFWGFQHVEVRGWGATGLPPPAPAQLHGIAISTLGYSEEAVTDLAFAGVRPSVHIAQELAAEAEAHGGRVEPQPYGLIDARVLAGVWHATLWSQRSNFISQPSDCPNREKLGWMGDASVSGEQAMTTFDAAAAYRSWLQTQLDNQRLAAAQLPHARGVISPIVPAPGLLTAKTDASWSAAIIELLAQAVTSYGDDALLVRAYSGAREFWLFLLNHTDATAKVMIDQWIWGDWDAQFDRSVYVPVTGPICATSNMLRSGAALAALAVRAGHPEDVTGYQAALAAARPNYNAYYARNLSEGTYADGIEQTSTAVMPLAIGAVPPEAVPAVTAWLIHDLETTRSGHLMTGASGTRHLFHVLSAAGRTDLALAVAAASTFPSHGWWLTQGATTCWENWSGVNDTSHPPPPTHNHIFLCSTSGWVVQRLLGIRPAPGGGAGTTVSGYEFGFALAPPLVDALPSMAGTLATPRGAVSLAWEWQGPPMASTFVTNASLPPGTGGSLAVPVPGLADPLVAEGGIIVFAHGAFVPGRAGVVGATYDASAGTITLELLPGDYAVSTANGAGGQPVRVTACAAPSAALQLTCPPRTAPVHILRAGIMAADQRDDAPDGRHRFLMTHTIERLCTGAGTTVCVVPWHALASATPQLQINTRQGERVCATALCNAA
jgi:alpha-L-rhamnosidase